MPASSSFGPVRKLGSVVLCVMFFAGCGDVVFESDPCKYDLNNRSVQFHTYQGASWGQGDCDDIPATGLASLSMVFPDKGLREMPAKVQIFAANSWEEAQRLDPTAHIAPILALPAQIYPSGVIAINHDFPEPGYFVSILTLSDEKLGNSYSIRFPFRVASSTTLGTSAVLILVGGLLALGLGVFRWRAGRPGLVNPLSVP